MPAIPFHEAMQDTECHAQRRDGPQVRLDPHESCRRRAIAHARPSYDQSREVQGHERPAVIRGEGQGHEHAQIDPQARPMPQRAHDLAWYEEEWYPFVSLIDLQC